MRLLRNIFLFSALFVLLGHSLIPHNHKVHRSICNELHPSEPSGFFDLLLHILEEDLGEGHLENIALNSTDACDAALVPVSIPLNKEAAVPFVYGPYCQVLPTHYQTKLHAPRAPPIA